MTPDPIFLYMVEQFFNHKQISNQNQKTERKPCYNQYRFDFFPLCILIIFLQANKNNSLNYQQIKDIKNTNRR